MKQDTVNRYTVTYSVIFLVGALNVSLSAFALLTHSAALQAYGMGPISLAFGVVFLILGVLVMQGSMIGLLNAVILYLADSALSFAIFSKTGHMIPIGPMIMRVLFLAWMIQGFGALRNLDSLDEDFSPRASNLVKPPPISGFTSAKLDSSEAERRRLEYSRTKQPKKQKMKTLMSWGGVKAGVKPISSQLAASAIRFVVYRCEITTEGLKAIYTDGKTRKLAWDEIISVVTRQLPPDQPWEGKIVLDILAANEVSEKSATPIRIFATTFVNYASLPDGAASSSQENIRRMGAFISAQNQSIAVDSGTQTFLQTGKMPPRFMNMTQFAEYDATYG